MLVKISAAIAAAATVAIYFMGSTALRWYGVILVWLCTFAACHVLYAVVIFIITELTVKLDKEQEEPSKFWQWHFYVIAEFLCLYGGVKIHVSGAEYLPEKQKYLMVSNHRSYFDPIVKVVAFKDRKLVYVSKPGNFKIPIGGKVMHKCGCMALDRENNREALKTIKRATKYITDDVSSVVIYPEGTRSENKELLPFHAGSFKIAQKAGVPVVVVATRGTDDVKRNFPFRHTDVYIDILGTIDNGFVKSHSTREIAELAQSMIQSKLDKESGKEKSTVK